MIRQAIKQMLGKDKKKNLFATMESAKTYAVRGANPVFITGPGRSGTHFMAKLFEAMPGIAAYHLDDVGDSMGDSFEIYRKWNRFNISNAGFLNSRGFLMEKAQQQQARFVESNPLIAFSLQDLIEKFGGNAIIMVRHPRQVVESHFKKGWYKKIPESIESGYGYEYFHDRPNHFFSRIKPVDPAEYAQWHTYTRLGKIAWMWKVTYQRILEQVQALPPDAVRLVQLEGLNFQSFQSLSEHLKISTTLDEKKFNSIIDMRPGKGDDSPVTWDDQARQEFNETIVEVIHLLPKHLDSSNWLFK